VVLVAEMTTDEDERTELDLVYDDLYQAKVDAKYAREQAEGRIAELTLALEEALAYFRDNYDVVDGEDGPRPNKEMRLGQMIDEALYGIRF
jgi:hypothetical protein